MRATGPTTSRSLTWDGCQNVRDLGGLPIEGGGTTRFGVVVRADNVRRLTRAGWRAFRDHGVARVIDLRWHEELAEDPPVDVPVEIVHVPLFGLHRIETRYAQFAEIAKVSTGAADFIRRLYGSYLEEHPDGFAAAVAAVAGAEGTVVVHCTRGKDRTGLISALLLRIAGVGIDATAADYGLTADSVREVPVPPERRPDDEARAREFILTSPAEAMAMVLRDLEAAHGSVAAYLEAGGLDRSTVEQLRRRFVSS